jgi:hypothetical protein
MIRWVDGDQDLASQPYEKYGAEGCRISYMFLSMRTQRSSRGCERVRGALNPSPT